VHKRYSDKTMLTIKTNLLKIEQSPVNKGTFIGTGGTWVKHRYTKFYFDPQCCKVENIINSDTLTLPPT